MQFRSFADAFEVGIYHHETKKIQVSDLSSYRFPIDEKYIEKLAECNIEFYAPSMLNLGMSPLLLIVDNNPSNSKKIKLYYYVIEKEAAYFIECDFEYANELISKIVQKNPFKAKKMPILRLGELQKLPEKKENKAPKPVKEN